MDRDVNNDVTVPPERSGPKASLQFKAALKMTRIEQYLPQESISWILIATFPGSVMIEAVAGLNGSRQIQQAVIFLTLSASASAVVPCNLRRTS
jgi:hypothetical protein